MKLDFTFDAALVKLTDDKSDAPKELVESSKPLQNENEQSVIIASPGTDDLGMKIASVKNVWATPPMMPTVFEHGISSSSASTSSVTINNSQPPTSVVTSSVSSSQQAFGSFNNTTSLSQSMVDQASIDLKQPMQAPSVSDNLSPSPAPVSGLGPKQPSDVMFDDHNLMSSVGMSSNTSVTMANYMDAELNKVLLNPSEQSNVCKVKPQLQTPGGVNITQTVAHVQQTTPIPTAQPTHLSAAVPLTPTSPQAPTPQAVMLQTASNNSPPSSSLAASLSSIPSPPAAPSYIIAAPVSHYQQMFGSSPLVDQRVSLFYVNVTSLEGRQCLGEV